MSDLNAIYITGNLTKDPDIRYMQNGNAVLNFQIASNEYFKKQDGSGGNAVVFIGIVLFGKQTETLKDDLRKGVRVLIEGKLNQEFWKDTESGAQRSKYKIKAMRVQVLSGNNIKKENSKEELKPEKDDEAAPV